MSQINVRPETQVMSSQQSNAAHHKPSLPAPATSQFIVLDDLVKKAVNKEWLELDYGAQWWSNDHAPTIYANSKLIPSLSTFLSNRLTELEPILQKRPVATRKIRLKKEKSASYINVNATTNVVQQNPITMPHCPFVGNSGNNQSEYNSTLLQQNQTFNNLNQTPTEQSTFINILSDNNLGIKRIKLPSVPLEHMQSALPSEPHMIPSEMSNVPPATYPTGSSDIYAFSEKNNDFHNKFAVPCHVGQAKSDTPTCSIITLKSLLENKCIYNNSEMSSEPGIKLKIKLNNNKQSRPKASPKSKKKPILDNEKSNSVEKVKKVKLVQTSDKPKKKIRKVKIKYLGVHKLKKCSVVMERLSDDDFRKYFNKYLNSDFNQDLYKTGGGFSNDLKLNNTDQETVRNCDDSNNIADVPTKSRPDSIRHSLLSDLSITPVGIGSNVPCCDMIPKNNTVNISQNCNEHDRVKSPEKQSHQTVKSSEKIKLTVAEKIAILKSDNTSVTFSSLSRSTKKISSKKTNVMENKISSDSTESETAKVIPVVNKVNITILKQESSHELQPEVVDKTSNISPPTIRLDLLNSSIKAEENLVKEEIIQSSNIDVDNNKIKSGINIKFIENTNVAELKRERSHSSPPNKMYNLDYVKGKIIPLGQRSSSCGPSLENRAKHSDDIPVITNCMSLASSDKLKTVRIKETVHKEELEKTTPLINSNKDNENNHTTNGGDIENSNHTIDMNMNYTNKLGQKALKINNPSIKSKHKDGISPTAALLKDRADSSDSNKENTFIEQSFDDELTMRNNHNIEEEPLLKKARTDIRNDENISKTNLKNDVINCIKIEEDIKTTLKLQNEITIKKTITTNERPIMELPSTSFMEYFCGKCDGKFLCFDEWKMHYDGEIPKCANVTAQNS